jgi:hypothetical protein
VSEWSLIELASLRNRDSFPFFFLHFFFSVWCRKEHSLFFNFFLGGCVRGRGSNSPSDYIDLKCFNII